MPARLPQKPVAKPKPRRAKGDCQVPAYLAGKCCKQQLLLPCCRWVADGWAPHPAEWEAQPQQAHCGCAAVHQPSWRISAATAPPASPSPRPVLQGTLRGDALYEAGVVSQVHMKPSVVQLLRARGGGKMRIRKSSGGHNKRPWQPCTGHAVGCIMDLPQAMASGQSTFRGLFQLAGGAAPGGFAGGRSSTGGGGGGCIVQTDG